MASIISESESLEDTNKFVLSWLRLPLSHNIWEKEVQKD